MFDTVDMGQWIGAGCWTAGGVLIGLLCRLGFSRLLRHARGTSWSWDDLAWTLMRDLAMPAAVTGGLWMAVEIVRPPQPLRGLTDKVLLVAIMLSVTLALARLAGASVREIAMSRSGVARSASIFVNITRIVVLVIGVLVLLQSLGISVTPLITALGVGGIAVALALQDTLANLFAGIHILASKKVEPGDYVKLASGEEGYIVDINWRNTTVRQLAGNIVVVPNSRFADAIMINFHHPEQDMAILLKVGVSYDSDLDQVERVTTEVGADVMKTVEGGVPEYAPLIRFNEFADSSINFTVILRVREYSAQYLVVHEFFKRLHARYRAEGIVIPYPTRTLVSPRRDSEAGHERLAALM